jgi:Ca-activated chloride channel family protein
MLRARTLYGLFLPVFFAGMFTIGYLALAQNPSQPPHRNSGAPPVTTSATPAQNGQQPSDPLEQDVTQGALRVTTDDGQIVECPLRHTDVKADISGFIARVTVTQTFFNPYDEKIEAVYVFPLPHTAAVDDMTMVIGERRIVGIIKRRAEARAIYEQALIQGLTASLLEQERPNIFTQSVGNIKPRQEINIEISYVDVLKYDMGTYEFHFPMVVGPRYIPGAPISKKPPMPDELKGKVGGVKAPTQGPDPKGTGWSPDTNRVQDASRITPPVLKPGYRTGHDISLAVQLDAGVPIQGMKVLNHQAKMDRLGRSMAAAMLSPADSVPNKDFVLRYDVVGDKPEMAVLTHATPGRDGYFMLMVQPKEMEEELKKAPPREVCFLIDVSGSMSGEPTAKVIDAMQRFFELTKPEDRIQVITFAGGTDKLFDSYVPASEKNINQALNFTNSLQGGGGTEMLKGIQAVLADPVDPERVRIVIMLTDGYIGNEAEIIREVGQRAGDQIRFWTIGIGSSPNRFLLDGVAKQGGGMSAVLGLKDDPTELVGQIVERIHRAQLAKIEIDWNRHSVYETYPIKIPELWAGRPVILFGRYQAGETSTIYLNGVVEGKLVSFPLEVSFPPSEPAHEVLAKVWARKKIEDLSEQLIVDENGELEEEITELALEYRLMSAYTSFVAVDESERGRVLETPHPPRRMVVPVPLPEGVSYEGVFGSERDERMYALADKELRKDVSARPMANLLPGKREALSRLSSQPARAAQMSAQMRRPLNAPAPSATIGRLDGGAAGLAGTAYVAPLPGRDVARLSEEFQTNAREPMVGSSEMAQQSAQMRHSEATQALTQARDLIKNKDWLEAKRRLQLAYFLEDAFLRFNPWSNDGTLAAITNELAAVEASRSDAAVNALPALGKRLDVVVRNAEFEAALQQIARAAGVQARIIPGGLDDARELRQRDHLRVAYLDLRHATAAQALTWLTQPYGLEWTVQNGAIVISSARRTAGSSAWVYSIGDLVVPTEQEQGKDPAKAAKVVETALQDFEKAMQRALQVKSASPPDAVGVSLLGLDRLLVRGDEHIHARAVAFITALRDSQSDFAKAIGREPSTSERTQFDELRTKTAARWAARAKAREDRMKAAAMNRAGTAMQDFTWALLAAACQGTVDDEAVSELLEAWNTPGLAEVLESSTAVLPARSLWAIAQARAATPNDPGLKSLADAAFQAMSGAVAKIAARFAQTPADANTYTQAVYLASLQSMPAGIVPSAVQPLPLSPDKVLSAKTTLTAMQAATSVLLATDPASKRLAKQREMIHKALAESQLSGDDWVVLAALALRRAGGEDWDSFRQKKSTLAQSGNVSGSALRVVNRLDRAAIVRTRGVKSAAVSQSERRWVYPALGLATIGTILGMIVYLRYFSLQ